MLSNTIDVVLDVEQVGGVLGQAAALLMASGLKYQKHSSIQNPDSGRDLLTLETEGNNVSPDDLSRQLTTIPGVINVIDIVVAPKADVVESSNSILDKAGSRIAEQLTEHWPQKLVELSQQYEDGFPRKQQELQVTNLGEVVGYQLAKQQTQLRSIDSIQTGLEDLVLPLLQTVANGQIEGERQLHVSASLFTRRYSNSVDLLFGSTNPKCYFLTGFIQGALNAVPSLPTVHVKETCCRAHGDDYCLFEIAEVSSTPV